MIKPGEGTARVCLSMEATDGTRTTASSGSSCSTIDGTAREVQVHLYVSQLLTEQECRQADLDLEASGKWTPTSSSACSTSR